MASRFIGAVAVVLAAAPSLPSVVASLPLRAVSPGAIVEIVPRDGSIDEGSLWCANSRGAAELSASCSIVLRSGSQEAARVDLGECAFVAGAQNTWTVRGRSPLRLLDRPGKAPLLVYAQYGSCNGDLYRVFAVSSPSTLAAMPFVSGGDTTDAVFADPGADAVRLVGGRSGAPDRLVITGYNNTGPGRFVHSYEETPAGSWLRK